jgi:hypothetical protein
VSVDSKNMTVFVFLYLLVLSSISAEFDETGTRRKPLPLLSQRKLQEVKKEYPPNYPFAWEWSQETHTFKPKYIELPSYARSLKPTFLTDPPTEPFQAHAEGKQDMFVLGIFNDKSNGFFVDLAASEWIKGSNTYVLEYFNNWKGICIEASSKYQANLLANRKCTLFINPVSQQTGEMVTFRSAGGLSGLVGTDPDLDNRPAGNPEEQKEKFDTQIVATTLTEVLNFYKAPKVIDYLSLDIEGAEYFAMKGFDFSKYIILLMSIERPKQRLHWLLVKHGYRFLMQATGWGECFYTHHTIPDFVNVVNKHHQPALGWFDESKPYLSYPKWNGTYIPYDQLPHSFLPPGFHEKSIEN